MTAEPIVVPLLTTGSAYVLPDMRTAAGTAQQPGGEWPATSLYMTIKLGPPL